MKDIKTLKRSSSFDETVKELSNNMDSLLLFSDDFLRFIKMACDHRLESWAKQGVDLINAHVGSYVHAVASISTAIYKRQLGNKSDHSEAQVKQTCERILASIY